MRVYPSIIDYVNTIENERNRNIVLDKLNGDTLQEIGERYSITRERVRQICKKFLMSRKIKSSRFREDKYLGIFAKYDISREDFTFAFDEPVSTYEYLKLKQKDSKNFHAVRPFEDILEDEDVPVSMRKQAERAIYRYYVKLNCQIVPKKRPQLLAYYVKNYCQELTTVDDFEVGYKNFLDELGLADDEKFQISGHAGEAFLTRSTQNIILENQWHRFRYYDIQSRDYGDFLEAINLMQYDGMEISTLKLFRDNDVLMKDYDIRDEYELHNLLRKIWDENDKRVDFTRRMPTIRIGNVDRDGQIWQLLLQYSPVSAERFGELYEEAYGAKAQTVFANYMKNFDKYFFNGVYSIDAQDLPQNEFSTLSNILTEDYYTVQDVKKIYLREFPSADISQINPYTLKTLGFRVYSSYVVRNTYSGAVDYFNRLLTGQDVIDTSQYPESIQNEITFSSILRDLRQQREIIEFSPRKFINIRKLNQFGVTKETLEDYCAAVSKFLGSGAFFTVHSIIEDGFAHSLEDLGFDELFYSSILMEDRARFTCQRLGSNRVFINGKSKDLIADMFLWLLGGNNKIDIYDLQNLLENHYGVVLDKNRLVNLIRSTDIYYNAIMEAVYIDYDAYFEEV